MYVCIARIYRGSSSSSSSSSSEGRDLMDRGAFLGYDRQRRKRRWLVGMGKLDRTWSARGNHHHQCPRAPDYI